MTFEELYTTVMEDVDEPMSDTLLLARIKNYINRGYIQLARREILKKVVTLKSTTGKFKIPTSCLNVITVMSEGNTVPFTLEGSYIKTDLDTIDVKYSYVPDRLEYDDDETETKDVNAEFIINYAKWLYYLGDGLLDEATIFKREYETFNVLQAPNDTVKIVDVLGVM